MTPSENIEPTFRQLGLRVFERGWLSSNNVLFAATRRAPATVVDTGYDTHAEQTLALLEGALGDSRLERIVNTHLHSDHCGANAAIQRRWGAEAWIHEPAYDAVAAWDESRLSYRPTDQRCSAFRPDRALAHGERIAMGGYDWLVASAGGHDPDAVMLFQPDSGVALTGDALWRDRVAIIFPEVDGADGFDDALAALDLIASRAPTIVVPGHGAPFTDVGEALRRSRSRLEQFQRDPRRHLDYAERALVMFHMLEHRERPADALRRWLADTPVFRAILERKGRPLSDADDNAERVLASLVAGGQLIRRGASVAVAARAA